jgi:hypothetical protein
MVGITQVSWQLGHILVVALRPAREADAERSALKMFRTENQRAGNLVAEVTTSAEKLPNLGKLTALSPFAWGTVAWFYSTHPSSPVSSVVAQMERNFRTTTARHGTAFVIATWINSTRHRAAWSRNSSVERPRSHVLASAAMSIFSPHIGHAVCARSRGV